MKNENQMILKQQYVAAMSLEMKAPLQLIVNLASDGKVDSSESAVKIKDAADYLLSLVDELADFARVKP